VHERSGHFTEYHSFVTENRSVDSSILSLATTLTTHNSQDSQAKPMRPAFLVTVFLLLSIAAAAPLAAQDAGSTLKGLKSVSVTVENLAPDVEQAGLTKSQLTAAVEAQLRQAGIQVKPDANEYLHVRVATIKPGSLDGFVYRIDIELKQPATILRTQDSTIATTWSTGNFGMTATGRVADLVRGQVRDFLDKFTKEWSSVNPKP
jgi:hypothetical protein